MREDEDARDEEEEKDEGKGEEEIEKIEEREFTCGPRESN